MTDAELWQRWKGRRDRDAFRRLVEANTVFVHDFARRVCGHDADAEDVAQEAFLELAEAPLERPLRVGLRAFLGRRVVLAAKTLRRAALSRRAKEAQAPLPAAPRPGVRPETEEALALLDDDERHAIVLRFLHGLSYAEAAEVLGVSEGAARVRVHRALRKLRERLGPKAESAIAALPLFLPAATFPQAATGAAAIEGGVVLMTASANRYLVVALALLLLMGGVVATQFVPSVTPARAAHRAPSEAATTLAPVEAGRASAETEGAAAGTPMTATSAAEEPAARGKGWFAGRIRFADGTPVRDMLVGTVGGHEGVRTDDEGRFALDSLLLPPCTLYQLGGADYMLALAAIPAAAGDLEIVLERGATLEGRVRMEGTAQPVVDALFELTRPSAAADAVAQAAFGRTRSDAEGRFRFEYLLPASYDAILTAKGIEPVKVRLDVPSSPVEILVRRARDMTVRFAGLPSSMIGRKVTLGVWNLGDRSMGFWYWDLEIDADREVHAEAPPPGRYGINVHAPRGEPTTTVGYKQSEFENVANEPVLVVLESAASSRVEGTVLLPDGSPAADRGVRLERSQLYGRTDSLGRYAFAAVPAGSEALVLCEGLTHMSVATLEVPAQGLVRRDIRLTGTGSVVGRFTAAAAPNARVGLRRKSDGQSVAAAFFAHGGDGSFRFPFLEPGDYEIRGAVTKKGSVRRDVTVANDTVDVGDLAIEPTPEVPVVAAVPAGSKVAGEVQVRATGADGDAYGWLALDDEGRGFLRGLRPGRYRVAFTVAGCAPVEADIEVEAAPSRPLAFTLSPK